MKALMLIMVFGSLTVSCGVEPRDRHSDKTLSSSNQAEATEIKQEELTVEGIDAMLDKLEQENGIGLFGNPNWQEARQLSKDIAILLVELADEIHEAAIYDAGRTVAKIENKMDKLKSVIKKVSGVIMSSAVKVYNKLEAEFTKAKKQFEREFNKGYCSERENKNKCD